jgi:peptidoglycan/LPS O-acetylase OafA/YrhL
VSSARPRLGTVVRRDIEGLRAIAVLFVLIYHLGVDRLSGGFAGVDIFFVISGFLITSALLSEAERFGIVSLLRFYARRARRLLPAASVVLMFTAGAGWLVLPGDEQATLATDVAAAALYVVNWALASRSVDYLAEDGGVSPVQHYWSLSVEEQFYVVIPVMLVALAWLTRRLGWRLRPVVAVAIGVVVLVSLGYSVVHTATSPQASYFYTTTRAWELGIGSLVACAAPLARHLTARAAAVLAVAGLVTVVAAGLIFTTKTAWPGGAALVPTLGTAAVIASGVRHSGTPAGRLLGLRPLVFIGGLSYSIYLWHWPLLILAGALSTPTPWRKAVIALASVALAWMSKKCVEDPIRFGSPFAGRTRPALVMGATGMIMTCAVAGFVWLQAPRLGERPATAVGALALMDPVSVQRAGAGPALKSDRTSAIDLAGDVYPEPGAERLDVPAYYDDDCQVDTGETNMLLRCVYGKTDGAVTVALAGDSKAGQWADVLARVATERGWRLELYIKGACGLNPAMEAKDCRAYNEKLMTWLTSPEGHADVVLTSAGRGNNDESRSREPAAEFVQGYDAYWKRLESVGTQVVAIGDVPSISPLGLRSLCIEEHPDDLLACAFPANAGTGTESLREAAELQPGRGFIDVAPWVCPETSDERCPAVVGNVLVYRQGSHVTRSYADSMQPIFDWALDKVVHGSIPVGAAPK